MSNDDTADSILHAERARRPRWRDSAAKPAPAWFRGEELDLVEPAERRQLYLAATARMGPLPWPQFLGMGGLSAILLARGHATWHWWYGAALAVWIAGAVSSTMLRRKNIRDHGRNALRESADWPQRLEQSRA